MFTLFRKKIKQKCFEESRARPIRMSDSVRPHMNVRLVSSPSFKLSHRIFFLLSHSFDDPTRNLTSELRTVPCITSRRPNRSFFLRLSFYLYKYRNFPIGAFVLRGRLKEPAWWNQIKT